MIWSYIGFSNLNYGLSEVKNPTRTIRIAGPLAIGLITVLYILVNIAYFAGASKEEITGSGRLVAALLFRNVYGPRAERCLSVFVALSAFRNVLSVVSGIKMPTVRTYSCPRQIFSHGRVNQELGREGILPASKIGGSNRPLNDPIAGIGLRMLFLSTINSPARRSTYTDWAVCLIVMFALPPGDAYTFVINVGSSLPLFVSPSDKNYPGNFVPALRDQRSHLIRHYLPLFSAIP